MAQIGLTTSSAVLNSSVALTESTLESATGTTGLQISNVGKCNKLGIYMEESSGTASTWSIQPATTSGSAFSNSGIGRLDVTLTSATPRLVVVEGTRFLQTDGTIDINNGTSSADLNQTHSTGIISVFSMPDG